MRALSPFTPPPQRFDLNALVLVLADFPVLLPVRLLVRQSDLNRRHLVFRAVRGPVGILRGDHVGARYRMVERRVDNALRHALGNQRPERRRPHAAGDGHHLAVPDAAHLRVMRMDFENVLGMPGHILGAPRLRPYIILGQDAPRSEDEREEAVGALRRRHEFRDHETSKPAARSRPHA